MYRYPKHRHPKLNCCQRHMILDAGQLDIHRLMKDEGGDVSGPEYGADASDDIHSILAYLWDNFDQCLVHARTIGIGGWDHPPGTGRPVAPRAFPVTDHLVGSARALYARDEFSECGVNKSSQFEKRWVERYQELLYFGCTKCTPTHILCCEVRADVQPPSFEQYLYLKFQPENHLTHIYLPLPNQTWAMYVRDHLLESMGFMQRPILPQRSIAMIMIIGNSNQQYLIDEDYVKQMHLFLLPGYQATPVTARVGVRVSMVAGFNMDRPLCFDMEGHNIRSNLRPLYWDQFSLELPDQDSNCPEMIIIYQIRKMVDKNQLQVVFPGTVGNFPLSRISQYLPFPALSKLSKQLGGGYSKTNFGIIGHGMAKVLLRLLSDPYILQATNNSQHLYTAPHHGWGPHFPQIVMENHLKLVKSEATVSDYCWYISQSLCYGLNEYEHLNDPTSRGRQIWENVAWDYVPLLRAATILSKHPCLLLWYYLESSPLHSLNPSINNGHLSQALQEMDRVGIEMKMAGISSTYFLQLYLDFLGKYALEIFAAIHIRTVHHFWWNRVAALNRDSQLSPPECSCSPLTPRPDDEEYEDVDDSDFLDRRETMEITE
jgi:hypothetical protein